MARALTVVTPVRDDHLQMLEGVLRTVSDEVDAGRAPFPRATTHFARWVLLPRVTPEAPVLLVLEANHDGSQAGWLTELGLSAGPRLDAIDGCCSGWPAEAAAQRGWLAAHTLPAAAFYQGYPDHTVQAVANDRRLHQLAGQYLDQLVPAARKRSATEIRRGLREWLERAQEREPGLALAPSEHGPPTAGSAGRIARIVGALALALPLALLALPALLVAAPLFLLRLRRLERSEPPDVYHQPVRFDPQLTHEEDWQTQNQLTHLVTIKPGRLRMFAVTNVLRVVGLIARLRDNVGNLGGIPSIHFARWVILPDRRVLFLSNFDGSWESYLGDFIDRAAKGLTGIWTNTVGFPRTDYLLWKGAEDEEAFKNWTRKHQLHTQVWYSSCPDASIPNVHGDAAVRRGLSGELGEVEAQRWLEEV